MGIAELQERDRNRIDDKYKWNIADVYRNDDAADDPAADKHKGA